LSPLIEQCSEKYARKLIGKTDMEDGLKMFDELTREVAQMATMEVLRTTHTIDNMVRGVDNRVRGVDDRVVGIDDKIDSIDSRVHSSDETVVDDRAAGVKTKVTIIGAQIIFSQA
jgi:hypothetical protein